MWNLTIHPSRSSASSLASLLFNRCVISQSNLFRGPASSLAHRPVSIPFQCSERFYIGCRGEQNIIYKSVKTSPYEEKYERESPFRASVLTNIHSSLIDVESHNSPPLGAQRPHSHRYSPIDVGSHNLTSLGAQRPHWHTAQCPSPFRVQRGPTTVAKGNKTFFIRV